MKKISSYLGSFASGLIAAIVLIIIWEVLCTVLGVREVILPKPSSIYHEILDNFLWYMENSLYTLIITLMGFFLAAVGGVLIAVALVSSKVFERFFYPLIVGFNSVPKVALAPLFVVWMGTGSEPKIAIAFLISVFAVIVDTVHGFKSVDQDLLDLSKVLKAKKIDVFLKIRFPSALPSIVAGLKVALSLALVGAIVGEFVSSQKGLGHVIMSAQGVFDTVRVFSSLVILAVMGMLLYALLALVESYLVAWRHTSD